MKIAHVAPLYESVPPRCYGGTERIVSFLTEELVAQGHEVTLFASGDSLTRARHIAACPRALRLESSIDMMAHHILLLEKVFDMSAEFDIIHFHIDYLHYPLTRRQGIANITTLHGRLDIPDLLPLYREFREMPVVSISDAQRLPLPGANWRRTIHHGLPENLYRFHGEPGQYLAFLGRISPEKRVDRAIEIARECGIPLKIAAKVDRVDQEYFNTTIRPLLSDPLVEYLGEIDDREKEPFLGNAMALLFPIDWPEPFGLVMIESLACGTPVIAYRRGSVPEVLEEGVTGYMVQDQAGAIEAVRGLERLSRRRCREVFERRFSVSRMVEEYLSVYEEQIHAAGARKTGPALRRLFKEGDIHDGDQPGRRTE